ncbi:hypothetical protein PLICRDRAFT_209869 [Plicaturopsis crispa FD-325 SS-3]|nr:hypothetical protein PLICRDRAFT_209869 [Plicaturopsis crispa FD-325 SS-3]
MRRKYGIPDDDRRPFNVAYAAVRARQEREAKDTAQVPNAGERNALAELRQRLFNNDADTHGKNTASGSGTAASRYPSTTPGYIANYDRPVQRDPLNFADRYNPNPPAVHVIESTPQPEIRSAAPTVPSYVRQSSRKALSLGPSNDSRQKRSLDTDAEEDAQDAEHAKKSRVEGDELIDGDEEASWSQEVRPQRGSKRLVEEDEDGDAPHKHGRDKRARKVSRDVTPEDEEMEDADELMELDTAPRASVRGKKRDRAEAGSTFGGDDDEDMADSETGKDARRRKRRTVAKRKSEVASRGTKRDRDAEEDELSEAGQTDARATRKKRGKKGPVDESAIEEGDISVDPLCKGRRIGEEWEINGVQYKVGLNGERLRQALVKKARTKFPMPKDSTHPDRQANLEVFVETWLTDAQYQEAKDRHELAWQDSPPPSEPQTPGDVPDSPSKGKNLLWSSTSAAPSTPTPAPSHQRGVNVFRQSIATNVGLRMNPFLGNTGAPGRRVASAYNTVDSSGKRAFRSFSKWEKQDLEAAAMARMREQRAAEQKPATPPQPAPTAPSFSLPKPTDKPAAAAATLSFAAPPTPANASEPAKASPAFSLTGAAAKPPTNGASEPEKPKPASTFSWPASTSTPSTDKPKEAPKQTFGFGQPPPATAPAPAPAPAPSSSSSSTVPNFFGAKPSQPQTSTTPVTASQPNPPPAKPAPQSAFGFPAPPASANATPSPAPSTQSSSPFSFGAPKPSGGVFGAPSQPEQKPEQKPAASSGEGSSSLLGRLGGFAPNPSTQPQPPASGGSGFSFGKPGASESSKPPVPLFGASAPKPAAPPAPSTSSVTPAASTSAPAPVKFNFGFGSKPATPPAPSTSGSGNSAKPAAPATNAFGLGAPKPAEAPSNATNAAAPAAPSFGGFGAFGNKAPASDNKSAFSSPFSAAPKEQTTSQPAFGGFGGGASSTPSGTPTSVFGGGGSLGGGGNAFSTTPSGSPNVFGGGDKSTSAFGFGSKPGETKSVFGATTESKPAETKPTGFSFSFGAPANNNSNTNGKDGSQPSVFGGGGQPAFGKPAGSTTAPTPNAFGFGNATGTGGFSFGSQGGSGQQPQQK